MTTTPKAPEGIERLPRAKPDEERPEGFVADAPVDVEQDESEWAALTSKRVDAANAELAKARAKLAALARAKPRAK